MREQYIEYRDGEAVLEGFLCYDEALPGPRPAVLIHHAWGGRDDFAQAGGKLPDRLPEALEKVAGEVERLAAAAAG